VSEAPSNPSEAIRLLFKVLGIAGIRIVPSYVAHDLANIRRARPDDEKFAAAVNAVAKEILLASKSPATFGVEVRHELEGWRRSKFASGAGGGAHLRLIFRPTKPAGIEILAFGDRAVPQSVYSTAKERT
jgi:hypothetical protein